MKTVLITGCSSGFGLELVPRYLERGFRVYATMRNANERANLFTVERSKYPDRFHLLELDITLQKDREFVEKKLTQDGFGLDCLVNNAGFGLFGALEDLSQTQIRQQMEVNFFGLLFLTQTLLPLLRKNRGRILNISSVVGYMGLPFTSLYSSSKFALEGLTESLYYEAKPFGVQVCLIEPGQHRTDFGKKLIYGEKSFEPFSPYFRFSKKFKEFRESSRKKPGVPSSSVVDKIVLLSEKKTIPLHVPIGIDAKLSYYLKKLLPAGLFFTLMYKIFSAKFFKISTEAETQQY